MILFIGVELLTTSPNKSLIALKPKSISLPVSNIQLYLTTLSEIATASAAPAASSRGRNTKPPTANPRATVSITLPRSLTFMQKSLTESQAFAKSGPTGGGVTGGSGLGGTVGSIGRGKVTVSKI